jgi:ornithine cyclodeaminase/alanine dehydrogenase-like protein (mu-crystallin family)
MAAVIKGQFQPGNKPTLFKSSGMSWEDLVVAEAVASNHAETLKELISRKFSSSVRSMGIR